MGGPERERTLQFLSEVAGDCERCPLAASRTKAVFGSGDPFASLMIVGEAPGADEDAAGQPFVGDAGRELDGLLRGAGLSRADAYVANVVKCRPPGNRPPAPEELAACAPYLDLQLAVVQPRVVLALGATAAHRLLGTNQPLREVRGRAHPLATGAAVIATYHPSPSSLNRDPQRRSLLRADLRLVRDRLLDAGA